ncbi:MAG: hypothetical protein ACRDQA_30110 [Nocardioidaceae bacterium]
MAEPWPTVLSWSTFALATGTWFVFYRVRRMRGTCVGDRVVGDVVPGAGGRGLRRVCRHRAGDRHPTCSPMTTSSEPDTHTPRDVGDGFNTVIHAPVRLRLCAALQMYEEVEFVGMLEILDISKSALSKHVSTLAQVPATSNSDAPCARPDNASGYA